MPNYNKLIMIGHLTKEPTLKVLPSGTSICEGGIAVNHTYGEKKEVCFLDWVSFGKSAELMQTHLTKGQPVLLEGRLALDSWTSQDGQKRSKHKMVVDRFTFVGGNPNAQQQPAQSAPPAQPQIPFSDDPAAPTGDQIPF